MQDDGNLVIYNVGHSSVWSSGTMQGKAKTPNPSLKMPPRQTLKASGHQLTTRQSRLAKESPAEILISAQNKKPKSPQETLEANKYVTWELPGKKRSKIHLRKPSKMSKASRAALVESQAWHGA